MNDFVTIKDAFLEMECGVLGTLAVIVRHKNRHLCDGAENPDRNLSAIADRGWR